MDTELNYHHLRYFWSVAEMGGISAASRELGVAPATVSAQVKQLEGFLGVALFERRGRTLVLTDAGERTREHARQIFAAGRDLLDDLRSGDLPGWLSVGVSDAVPKLITREVLRPVLTFDPPTRLRVKEGEPENLLGDLATHSLDLVITDEPVRIPAGLRLALATIGESAVSFFGSETLVASLREGFPDSLDGAPALLPSPQSALRRSLDRWFVERDIVPSTVAECDDTALLKIFAREGYGFLALPRQIGAEVTREHGLVELGPAPGCREVFYAISVERHRPDPRIEMLLAHARARLSEEEGAGD